MNHEAEVVGIGVGAGPRGDDVPVVLLRARDEYLPIFVTPDQARSIRQALEGDQFDRPLTHDLLVEVVTEFGGALDAVRIDDLADGTFYGKLDAERYEDGEPDPFVFDVRPSDAIAIATRVECPILVADEVLDDAARPADAIELDGPDAPDGRSRLGEPDDVDRGLGRDVDADVDRERDPDDADDGGNGGDGGDDDLGDDYW